MNRSIGEIVREVFEGGVTAGQVGYGDYHYEEDIRPLEEELTKLLTKAQEEAVRGFAAFLTGDPYWITEGSTDYFLAMQLFKVWQKEQLDKEKE